MTEAGWLASTDPLPLLEALSGGSPSDRKLRLFACACCRRLWHLLSELDRAVVTAIERCADGEINQAQIYEQVGLPAGVTLYGTITDAQRVVREAAGWVPWDAATRARAYTVDVIRKAEGNAGRAVEWARQADSIRCIFGNPFCPFTADTSWLTADVLALTRGMYTSRDFSAAPILADALQDAGCANPDALNHLRHGGEHARGCWVLDALLEKG